VKEAKVTSKQCCRFYIWKAARKTHSTSGGERGELLKNQS
jgi:hypothetical protein